MGLINKLFHFKPVPFFVLSFPVFVDIFNGMMQGADSGGDSMVGLLYRGGILLLSIPLLGKYKYNKHIATILVIGGVSLIYHMLSGGFSKNDFTQFVKIVYGFFFLAILLKHRQFKDIGIVCDCAIFYGFAAAISLIICKFLGTGYASYAEGTFGFRGFFIAMNDVGLTMLMMNALSLYRFLETDQWRYFIFSVTIASGCALVGSMACYLGTVALYIAYVISPFIIKRESSINQHKKKGRTRITILVIICLSVYAVSSIVNIIMEDSYLSNKYADVGASISENSGRSLLIDAGKKYLESRPLIEVFWGSGDNFLYGVSSIGGYGSQQAKGVESDFWDLYGCYGLLFVILVYWLPVKVLFRSMRLFVKRREQLFYWTLVLSLIFLGHAFYGGHAFTSPMSASYYMITIYLIEENNQRRKKVASASCNIIEHKS